MIHLNSGHVLEVMANTTLQERDDTSYDLNNTSFVNGTVGLYKEVNYIARFVPTSLQFTEAEEKRIKWKDYMRFVIPSSYVFGYVVTQIPAGRLAEWIGTKYLFASMQVTSALMTAFSPAMAQAGLEFFIMARITLGTAQVNSFFFKRPSLSDFCFHREPCCHRCNLWL